MSDAERTIRGCVLMISNSFVNRHSLDRMGPHKHDVTVMKNLWEKMLKSHSFPITGSSDNPDFEIHEDVNAQDMVKLLTDFAAYRSRIDYSYMAVIISTHGGLVAESWVENWVPGTLDEVDEQHSVGWEEVYNDYNTYCKKKRKGIYKDEKMVEVFFGNDFRPVKECKIKELFYNDAAPVWQNVPKFFVLDYCRGDAVDCGVIRTPPTATPKLLPIDQPQPTLQKSTEMAGLLPVPRISDVLTVYATHLEYVAFQGDPEFGSWLISTIAKVFTKYAKRMHVVDMLTIVNKEMKEKWTDGDSGGFVGAMSIYQSSLAKNLYLCDEAESCGECFNSLIKENIKTEEMKMLHDIITQPEIMSKILSDQGVGSTRQQSTANIGNNSESNSDAMLIEG